MSECLEDVQEILPRFGEIQSLTSFSGFKESGFHWAIRHELCGSCKLQAVTVANPEVRRFE